jgi:hypothetical protein
MARVLLMIRRIHSGGTDTEIDAFVKTIAALQPKRDSGHKTDTSA